MPIDNIHSITLIDSIYEHKRKSSDAKTWILIKSIAFITTIIRISVRSM